MLSPYEPTVLAATVLSGLTAGICFAFASFLLPAFDRLGAPNAIRVMQAINIGILRSSAMAAWFGTVLLGALAVLLAEERALALVATGLYALGAILITGRGNVPLNEELDRVDPDAENSEEAWRRYRLLWSRWNLLRTVALALASACFALAL